MLGTLLVGVPATADHGPGGADCPTGITETMYVFRPDGTLARVEEGTSAPAIVFGDPIIVGGFLKGEAGANIDDQPVTVTAGVIGGEVHTFPMTTEGDGSFDDAAFPGASARWAAHWTGSGTCDTLHYDSKSIFLGVRVAVSIVRSHLRPPAGYRFAIRGTVEPNHAGKVVTLQWRKVGSSVVRSATLTLDSLSRYGKRFVFNTQGSRWDFRAIFSRQDDDHHANRTPWVRVAIR
jgi:hypothetical protein